jgi:hypothetical protein
LSGKGTGEYRKGSTPSDIASRSGSREREMEADAVQAQGREMQLQLQGHAQQEPGVDGNPEGMRGEGMLPYPGFGFEQGLPQI